MSIKFSQTYSIAGSGTKTLTTTDVPSMYLMDEFHVTVTGTGTVEIWTKEAAETTATRQATVVGGSQEIILDMLNVVWFSMVEIAGNAVSVTTTWR